MEREVKVSRGYCQCGEPYDDDVGPHVCLNLSPFEKPFADWLRPEEQEAWKHLDTLPEVNSDVRPQETVPNPAVRGDCDGSEGVVVATSSWTWEHFIKAIKCSILGWPKGEVEKALEFAILAKFERDKLRDLLERATPAHTESTCWYSCMDGEPEKCVIKALIKEIEEALKEE